MLPPAPARFSTTTGWRHSSLMRVDSARETGAVGPTAGKGTTSVTVFSGKPCAPAGAAAAASAIKRRETRSLVTSHRSPFLGPESRLVMRPGGSVAYGAARYPVRGVLG